HRVEVLLAVLFGEQAAVPDAHGGHVRIMRGAVRHDAAAGHAHRRHLLHVDLVVEAAAGILRFLLDPVDGLDQRDTAIAHASAATGTGARRPTGTACTPGPGTRCAPRRTPGRGTRARSTCSRGGRARSTCPRATCARRAAGPTRSASTGARSARTLNRRTIRH